MAHKTKARTRILMMEEYTEASETHQGICTHCLELSGDFVEPDAEGYECEHCGRPAVMGIEMALLAGIVSVDQDADADWMD